MPFESPDEVYSYLQSIPHSQWPELIASLTPALKKDLLGLIKRKKSDNAPVTRDTQPTSRPLSARKAKKRKSGSAHSPLLPSTCRSTRSRKDSLTATSFPDVSLPDDDDIELPTPFKASSAPTPAPTPAPQSVFKSRFRVLPIQPLERIGSLLIVAGDCNAPATEAQHLVHRYINFWICGLFYFIVVLPTLHCGEDEIAGRPLRSKGHSNSPPRSSQQIIDSAIAAFFSAKRKCTEHLSTKLAELFPSEMAKFNRDCQAQKLVQKNLAVTGSADQILTDAAGAAAASMKDDLSDSTGGEEERKVGEGDGSGSTRRGGSFNDNGNKNGDEARPPTGIMPFDLKSLLVPPDRFSDRLTFRDYRTRLLSESEYREFARAREMSLRSCKPLVREWLCRAAAATCAPPRRTTSGAPAPPKFKCAIPHAVVDSFIYLVSDRVSCVVELAIRLRRCADLPTLLERIRVEGPAAFHSLWTTQQVRLPTLADVAEEELRKSHSTFSTERIDPSLYSTAIGLLVQYVDCPTFFADEDPKVVFKILRNGGGSIEEEEEEAGGDGPAGVSLVEEAVLQRPALQLRGEGGARAATPTSSEAEAFFSELLAAALIEYGPEQFAVPSQTAVFVYLFCRDILWDSRHSDPREMRDKVNQRLHAWSTDRDKRNVLTARYKKVLEMGEALRKISALDKLLEKAAGGEGGGT